MAVKDVGTNWNRTTRNAIDDNDKNLQRQINDLVLDSGDSDAEVVQARGGEQVLNDRLDKQDIKMRQLEIDKANVSYVDNKFSQIDFDTFSGKFNTLTELKSAYPDGDDGIYLIINEAKWYYWNGSNWIVGGDFIAAPIEDNIKKVSSQFLGTPTLTNVIKNGNFNNLDYWNVGLGSGVVSNNVLAITSTGTSPNLSNVNTGFDFKKGHKVFLSVMLKLPSEAEQVQLRFRDSDSNTNTNAKVIDNPNTNQWIRVYGILELPMNGTPSSYFQVVIRFPNASTREFEVKEFLGIDLTQDFGAGNEPTVVEMVDVLGKYPNNFFDGIVSRVNLDKIHEDVEILNRDVSDILEDRDLIARNLIENGDFTKDSDNNGLADGFRHIAGAVEGFTTELDTTNFKINGSSQKVTLNDQTTSPFAIFGQEMNFNNGHKYFVASWLRSSERNITNLGFRIYSENSVKHTSGKSSFVPNQWERLSFVYEADGTETDVAIMASNSGTRHSNISVWYDGMIVLNLTEVFGVGNEPDAESVESLLSFIENSWFDGSRQIVTTGYLYNKIGTEAINKKNIYELPKILVDEAIGCWWTYPRAVRHKNKLYFTYTKNSGGVWISSYDYETGETQESLLIGFPSSDDHNQASISVLPDGRIMCIYARHVSTYNKLSLKISTHPEDISSFGSEIAVMQPGANQSQDYVQTFYVAGKFVSLYRWYARRRDENDGYYCAWSFRTSEDGINWSPNQYHLIGAGEMQYYGLFMQKDANTLRFYTYTNPDNFDDDKKIRYGEVNFATGDVSTLTLDSQDRPNGLEVIGNLSELVDDSLREGDGRREPVYTFEKERFNPIYQSDPSTYNNRILDATRQYPQSTDNKLLICEWEQSQEGYNAVYKSIRLNSNYTRTIEEGLPSTGRATIPLTEHQKSYYAGAVFEDMNGKIIHLARENDGVFYIEKWAYQDSEWKKIRTVDVSREILFRPISVLDDEGMTVWFKGDYQSLNNHDTFMTNISRG